MSSRLSARKPEKKACSRWYRPRIEALEERAVPSADTWTGGGDQVHWSDPANWSNGVPNPGDDLQFISSFGNPPPTVNDLPPWTTFQLSLVTGQPIIIGYGPTYPGGPTGPIYAYPSALPTLTGNAIVLTGGITTGLQPTIAFNGLALGADQTFNGKINISSPFDLNGFTLTAYGIQPTATTGPVVFSGPFLGNGAIQGVYIAAPITLTGPTSFEGNISAANGVNINGFSLTFDGGNNSISGNVSGAGSIIVNGGTNLTLDGFSGTITINDGGILELGGTYLAPLNVNTGHIQRAAGRSFCYSQQSGLSDSLFQRQSWFSRPRSFS